MTRLPSRAEALANLLQAGRFAIVGLAATATHVAIFFLLVSERGWGVWSGNVAGFTLAFAVSFAGHNRWTFRDPSATRRDVRRRFARFVLVALIGLGLNLAVSHAAIHGFGLSAGAAAILMATLVPGLLFLLNRQWAFRAEAPAREFRGGER